MDSAHCSTTASLSSHPARRLLHLDAAIADDPGLMSHWSLDNARAGAGAGRQVPNSVLRRLTIDLKAPDGESK